MLWGLPGFEAKRFRPAEKAQIPNWKGGGTDFGSVTLTDFYNEMMAKRATWSRSNVGYDLVKYGGVKLYLYPHPQVSYIFQWDRDYYEHSGWNINICQPANLMQMRNHVIVWSSSVSKGKPRPTKVFIKPPTQLLNKWYFQRDFARTGLFTWRISLFDPVFPFIARDATNTYDQIGVTTDHVYYSWWADTGTGNQVNYKTGSSEETHKIEGIPYYQYFWGYTPPSNTKISIWWWQDTTWKHKKWVTLVSDEDPDKIGKSGPFVPKKIGGNNTWNIFCRYKAYFQWGGDTPDSGQDGFDPNKVPFTSNQSSGIQDPSEVSKGTLHSWDIRRGIITKRALAELIRDSDDSSLSSETEAKPTIGFRGPISTKRGPSQEEDSSGDEETPLKKRRRKHLRKLVDTLVDVVRGLKNRI